jgi:hypothetical protein
LAAGAGAPAEPAGGGSVVDIAGDGLEPGVVVAVAGALDFAGAAGFDAPTGGVLTGTSASTGVALLAPPLMFTVFAALGGIAAAELLSVLHAQRLRAPIQRHIDDRVPLLDILIISVLQCVG